MKKSFKKMMAGVSVAAMLVSAMPITSAFAEEATFSVRELDETSVVITGYSDKYAEEIVIPSEIDGMTVVGVDDFAFALVSTPVSIVVPETLVLDNIGSEAFMTAAIVNEEVIAASGATTINGVIKYWLEIAGLNYTDAQIADAIAKAYSHIGEVPVGATVEETALMVIKEIRAGNCGFSQLNLDRLDLVLKTLPYSAVALAGPDGTDAQEYAAGKVNLVYNVTGGVQYDVTGDGVFDIYDVIAIAEYVIDMRELTDEQYAAADANLDGVVDLMDAIRLAELNLESMVGQG